MSTLCFLFFEFVPSPFQKSLKNFIAIIADNFATNNDLSRYFVCEDIACASHRLDLAVKEQFLEHKAIIESVNAKMKNFGHS